jgi:hypothetical protein
MTDDGDAVVWRSRVAFSRLERRKPDAALRAFEGTKD